MKRSELLERHAQINMPAAAPQGPDIGAIRNAAPYPRFFEALCRGQLVTVIGQADVVGMSPTEKVIDQGGLIDWVSSDELVVTQSDALPRSYQQLQALLGQDHRAKGESVGPAFRN